MPSLVPVPERIELSPAPRKPSPNVKLQNVAENSVNICGLGPTWLRNNHSKPMKIARIGQVRNGQFDSCNYGELSTAEQGQVPMTAKAQQGSF